MLDGLLTTISAAHQTVAGVASIDEIAIVGLSGAGIVAAVVALRLRVRDIVAAPDEESRYVARGRLRTNAWILTVQASLFAHGLIRATQARPDILPLPTVVSLYFVPLASLFALAVTANDLVIRRGVRWLRARRVEEP